MLLNGDQHELGQYVRDVADEMNLRDWTLEVHVRPQDELDEYQASCAVVHLRSYAIISFLDEWPTWTPGRLRQVTCHELLHCHTEKITTVVVHLRERMSVAASQLAERTYRAALEYAVDDIATAWAETLPLPVKDEPKRKKRKG